ncbi:MAG: metal ABC transporter ATP-binding protein [Lactovum sp.]
MALICCHELSLAYEGKKVIYDLNFEVNRKDYLCIVGENGSGKSTLIKSLLGLKSVESGKIMMGDGLVAKEIGYLPQQSSIQRDFPASINEVVLSGCLSSLGLSPFYRRKDREMANKNMEALGIYEFRQHCYGELSGGQQQRVLLARALCATKKILLLDEPVSGLDPLVTQEFYQLIKKINQEMDIAIIMVSHDIPSVVNYASHVLHLENGTAFFAKKEDYVTSRLANEFLGGERRV